MKKKTLILLAVALSLMALAVWVTRPGIHTKNTESNDWDFAISDTEQIARIFIADREGNTTLLEKKEGKWWYNDIFPARPNAMENLLDAIRRVKLKYRPSQAAIPGMVSSLSTEGLKVEIYNKAGQKIKAYYVGGATADERGTYMIMEDSNNPYVAHIPSWEGNLRFRYSLLGDDWKDKAIFAERQEAITRLSVTYPKQRNKSFVLEKQGGDFTVSPAFAMAPESSAKVKPGAVEAYLRNYRSVVAEAFSNQYPGRDSITNMVPFCTIRLQSDDKQRSVHFFPIFNQPILDIKSGQFIGTTEAERYYAWIEETDDFMLVQQRVFGELFRAYESFFEGS